MTPSTPSLPPSAPCSRSPRPPASKRNPEAAPAPSEAPGPAGERACCQAQRNKALVSPLWGWGRFGNGTEGLAWDPSTGPFTRGLEPSGLEGPGGARPEPRG